MASLGSAFAGSFFVQIIVQVNCLYLQFLGVVCASLCYNNIDK